MKVTLKDVAEAAGVSPMAVSVVLHGTGGKKVTVSEEKAEHIRRVAAQLRYRPNTLARSLRSKQTGAIAVVFQHFGRLSPERPYRTQILNGVAEALFPNEYTLSLCPRMMRDENGASIGDGRFDGILWCRPDFTEGSVDAIRGASVPIVLMHAPPGSILGVPTFCADNESAMRRVIAHLLPLGHERIAFVIDPISVSSVEGQARALALSAAADRAGLPEPEVLILAEDHSILSRYSKNDRPHSALICFSDELAGAVLASCEQLGVKVPGHISVIGFDSSWFCERTNPRLTSVNQPVERMAFEAASHLISLIQSQRDGNVPNTPVSSVYDCGLDVRDSTGPASQTQIPRF